MAGVEGMVELVQTSRDLAGDAMPALLQATKDRDCDVRVASVRGVTTLG